MMHSWSPEDVSWLLRAMMALEVAPAGPSAEVHVIHGREYIASICEGVLSIRLTSLCKFPEHDKTPAKRAQEERDV